MAVTKVFLKNGNTLEAPHEEFEYNEGVLYFYDEEECVIMSIPQENVLYTDCGDVDESDVSDEAPPDPATNTPDPGPGYRLIDKAVEEPHEGDQIYIGTQYGWVDRYVEAFDQSYDCFYRRRVTPEPVCKREAFSGGGSPSPRECGVCGEGPCEKKAVEEFPKYYVGKLWSPCDAYVRIDNREGSGVWVTSNGHESDRHAGFPSAENLTLWSWHEVTREQAMARVTQQPQPVESPDDWVTQDRVPRRLNIDEFRWIVRPDTEDAAITHWREQDTYEYMRRMHGELDADGDRVEVRCRRKDLPSLPITPSIGDTVIVQLPGDEWNGCKRTVIAKLPSDAFVVSRTGEPLSRLYDAQHLRVVPKREESTNG